jgi:hypothetical protein
VVTNGLNAWVIEVSGELSMTRVFPVVVALPVEPELAFVLELVLDEQAATPAASRTAADRAKNCLG